MEINVYELSISYFLYSNLKDYTSELKDEYKIEVFFNNDIDLSKSIDAFNKILLIDGVEEGSFIDKDAASKIFKEEFNEDIVEIIGENPLPTGATYGISESYRSYDSMKNITDIIKQLS